MKLRTILNALLRTTAAAGLSVAALASDPLVTNVSRFEIPFDVESFPGEPVDGFAVLFGSTDGGRTWDKLQTVPVTRKGFPFVAPRDGEYGFAVRRTDAGGNIQRPDSGTAPELTIVVDTTPPELELSMEPAGPGQARIRWYTPDSSADPRSLVIESLDATDGRWKPVSVTPAASGQTLISAHPGSVISARATLQDAAGNQADVSEQLMIPAAPPSTPGLRSAADPAAQPLTVNPLGPSPFADQSQPAAPSFAPRLPGDGSTTSASATSGRAIAPGPANGDSEFITQVPAAPVGGSGNAPAVQLLSHRVFDLSYQVDEVGPSGISAVELFVTEDGGQRWFRYGDDSDMRSPARVDVQGEGTFGFAIRVRSGLGLVNVPPQPGDRPDIVVTVDESPPQIDFAQPEVRADQSGVVAMQWQVSDSNPVSAPVRLERSTSPNGPWTPVFDWQVDRSGFQWPVQPGTPATLYFRLLARDAAGNVASATTSQPVLIDLKRPVARLTGAKVSAADGSTGY